MNALSKQFMRMRKNQINRGNFHSCIAEAEQQAVLLRNAVETPRMVGTVERKIAHLFHPVAAPWSGIEIGRHAERPLRGGAQSAAEIVPADHLRQRGFICVQQEIEPWQQLFLQTVRRTPLYKISAFIFSTVSVFRVAESKISDLFSAPALLYLPTRNIGIDDQIRIGT